VTTFRRRDSETVNDGANHVVVTHETDDFDKLFIAQFFMRAPEELVR
jgi:hypothetical protein